MAKKAAEKTAGINMSGFVPRAKVFDGQTPQKVIPKIAPAEGKKFTGVGIFMDSMTGKSEVSKELATAQSKLENVTKRLAEFDGASLMKALDPKTIRRSEWANRNELEFSTPEFQELKALIASSGGNEQAIKVRVVKGVFDGQTPLYEIVFGHRRHQACLELGLLVNAVIVEEMTDQALFEAMDRENRGRKNLSAWEQGCNYDDAIKKGLYPSIRRLVDALGVNLSDAARAVQLAKLPRPIIDAFSTPLDIQVRWAKPLADVLQRDPDNVLARAKELQKSHGKLTATEVFTRLVGKDQKSQPKTMPIMVAGKNVGTIKSGPKGRALIEFEANVLPAGKHAALAKLIEGFMKTL